MWDYQLIRIHAVQAAIPATDDIGLLLMLQEGQEKVKSRSMRPYYTLFWRASIKKFNFLLLRSLEIQ